LCPKSYWGGGLALFGSKRLKELEERVTRLKRELDERDLDWIDMRARCRRLLDRTEKAARALKPETVVDSDSSEVPSNNGVGETHTGRQLTPHQLQIQQQILKRRAGA